MSKLDTQAGLEERFRSAFAVHEGHTLNGSNANLHGLRRSALDAFTTLGFPAKKTEAWKYTHLDRQLRRDYQLALTSVEHSFTQADIDTVAIPELDAYRIVLVNGRYQPTLSSVEGLPEGVVVTGFGQASEKHADLVNAHLGRYAKAESEAYTALNMAFAQDGYFVYVPKNVIVEKPILVIQVLRVADDTFIQPRNLIVAERSSSVKIIEQRTNQSTSPVFSNIVTEAFTGANAHVDHYVIQDEGEQATQVYTLHAYQEGDSVFSTNTTTLSGEVVRNNMTMLPDAENCESHLLGLFLGNGSMHVDNHTLVDHTKPNCFSNELYKGILADRATGVFNGKVFVRPDAQKINAYQTNQTILLSDTAHMYTKPELEIYADDVKCSHGATTGQLDDEALFYLRARGINEQQARALLLLAFARDVLDDVKIEPLRAYLDARIGERFGA